MFFDKESEKDAKAEKALPARISLETAITRAYSVGRLDQLLATVSFANDEARGTGDGEIVLKVYTQTDIELLDLALNQLKVAVQRGEIDNWRLPDAPVIRTLVGEGSEFEF